MFPYKTQRRMGVGVYLHSFFILTIGGSEWSVSRRCHFSAGRDAGGPLKRKMWARERERTRGEEQMLFNYGRNRAVINPLKPNDPYMGRTAPLTSKRSILYIYSTNIGIEYFERGIYSPFFSLQNAVCFIILTYLVPVLFTFYIEDVLKLKKK